MRPSAFVGSFLLIFLFGLPVRAEGPVYGWRGGSEGVTDGYVLFAPYIATDTFLIDNYGRVVQSWPSDYRPGASVYLKENGDLIRTGQVLTPPTMNGGGYGGILEVIDSSGEQIWEYVYSSDMVQQHHDIALLPNGNILMIAWEYKTKLEAIAAGRIPMAAPDKLWPESIIELEPSDLGAKVVWEWHAWDHLIQDIDVSTANYGVVAAHPELIDINFGPAGPDWLHFNGIAYNAELDQILVTVHSFSEIWVIDHSTTTEEAASHEGGASGMGGDILYRWGNPQAHRAGSSTDRRLFGPHNAHWIPEGYPGEGNILIFNNGLGRFSGAYSTVDEIVPPLNDENLYDLEDGLPYGPDELAWSYDPDPSFYAQNVSGAQRLSNGNTLICSGPQGRFFEVDTDGEIVWEYKSPVLTTGPADQSLTATASGMCFRAARIELDHPALEAFELEPGDPIELYPHAMGDINNDGGVDLLDVTELERLFSSECIDACEDPLYPNALGRIVDFDGDWDVDCTDWHSFAEAWTSTGAPPPSPHCQQFLRGDADGSGEVLPIIDALFILQWVFLDGRAAPCESAADTNGNGETDGLSDAISLLIWGYAGGDTPPAPGPYECGIDAETPLSCEDPPECE